MTGEIGEIPADVRRLLEEHDWDETTPRLLRHAQKKIERLTWRGSWGGIPPGGIQPADLVQQVYEKVLAGARKWDPTRHPDLFEYLRDQVDSEISNLVTSSENKRMRSEGTVPPCVLEPSGQPSPEEVFLAKERKKESDDFVFNFMEFLGDEPELQQVVDAIVGGVEKRAEFAKRLKTSVEQIDARRKRLKRRLEEYMSTRKQSTSPRGGTPHARS